MKSTRMNSILLVVMAILMLSGCAGTPVTINSVPAQQVDLKNGRSISADACGFQLLLLIPISINSRLENAYTDLLNKAGKDRIGNVSIEESWIYAFVGTVYCTRLEAMAYPAQ